MGRQGVGESPALDIDQFRAEGSTHKPRTQAKVLYDVQNIYVFWRVHDRFVRCKRTAYNSATHRDSCVEFFFQPRGPGTPHFAVEINCGGTLMMAYVTDPTRKDGKLAGWKRLPPEHGGLVRVFHTMPKSVLPEIKEPTDWKIEAAIPRASMEPYCGPLGEPAGQTWRANFYKCADESSHPHFGSWSAVGGRLNFHQPEFFGEIVFAK